jgi:hypothetical protein
MSGEHIINFKELYQRIRLSKKPIRVSWDDIAYTFKRKRLPHNLIAMVYLATGRDEDSQSLRSHQEILECLKDACETFKLSYSAVYTHYVQFYDFTLKDQEIMSQVNLDVYSMSDEEISECFQKIVTSYHRQNRQTRKEIYAVYPLLDNQEIISQFDRFDKRAVLMDLVYKLDEADIENTFGPKGWRHKLEI